MDAGASGAKRRLGFRYFALVTGDDTDEAYVAQAAKEQGTAEDGMYFRINGAAFWSKGQGKWFGGEKEREDNVRLPSDF